MNNIATPLKNASIDNFERTHNKILFDRIEHHTIYSGPLQYAGTFLILLYQDRNDYKRQH